jgi:hypothetical protein
MELATLLEDKREAVLERWFDAIVKTYPRQTSEFLLKQKDQFRNPLGYAIERAIGPIYDQIVTGMNEAELLESLDGIVRIRSVQEFTPSQAVAFVFELKTVIREVLGDRFRDIERSGGLVGMDAKIDRVAMLAFDKYMECRQQLFEIRTGEIRRQSASIMERFTSKPRATKTRENTPMTSCDICNEKGGSGG